jgi:putative transcriptional regulator
MRTVVFVCDHLEKGTVGFVLNKILDQTLDELISDLADHPIPAYIGGPVQLDTIHFLHQYP